MNFDKKLDTYAKPSTRPVASITILANNHEDQTNKLRLAIKGFINYAGQDGIPARLNINFIGNNNKNLTDENKILALTVPIMPPLFSTNPNAASWTKNRDTFVRLAKTQESIQNSYNKLDLDARESYVSESSDLIMSYILTEIVVRYAVAKQNNDKRTMDQLQSLKVVADEDFDLDMFNLVLKRTLGQQENKNDSIRNYLNEPETQEYQRHQEILSQGEAGRKSAVAHLRDLKSFETYDIDEAEFNQTIGGHVILMTTKNTQNSEQDAGFVQQ